MERVGHLLASADSAAWSSHARRPPAAARPSDAIPTHHQLLLTDRSAA
ncbi:hypothetical protein ACWFRK_40150 [Streptomyces sp. NPDC055157]